MVVLEKNIFIDAIAQKNFAQTIGLNKVQEIVAKYPAFNSAYLIESILLNQENKVLFESKLPISAIHVRNRMVLHNLIYKQKPLPKSESTSVLENEKVLNKEEETKVEEKRHVEKAEAKNLLEAETQEKAQEAIELEEQKLKQAKEIVAIQEAKRLAEEAETKALEILEKERTTESVEEIDVEIEQEEKIKKVEVSKEREKKTTSKKLISKQEEKVKSLVNQEEFKQKESSKLDFLQWLKQKNNTKPQPSIQKPSKKKIVTDLQSKSKNEVEKEDLVPFERTSAVEAEMHLESKQSSDPLESFISSEILRKQRKRKEKIQPVSNAQNSSNPVIVSETLAEILTLQQKYIEAIEVYSLLSLKYPQKSIYFATQIEKIKNYL